ncbi:MAG: hypothetical protein IPH44_19970 [Myxococcales bacterium]|nr:hypothetical protein [Myxococcales bacterium]MBK7195125.1 hypothetical protein [Myxococcales bacterium]MBP6848031.1 hypothetical protein [Kofleriaceae bacterium]
MQSSNRVVAVVVGGLIAAAAPAVADEVVGATAVPVQATVVVAAEVAEPEPVVVVATQQPAAVEEYNRWDSRTFLTGAVVFGVGYGAAAITAGVSDRSADERLYVPLVGPWLDLADRGDCDVGNQACDNETTKKVLIVADGVVQAVGVLLVLDALLFPTQVHRTTVAGNDVRLTPVAMAHGGRGLGLAGSF